MDILLNTHSLNRYLLALLALVCIVRLIGNIVRGTAYQRTDAQWLRWFATIMTIQFALGLVLFVKDGITVGWDMSQMRTHMEHATTMIIALGLAHATASVRRKDPAVASTRALIFVSASLVLIVVGVARLKGFGFWFGA